MVDVGRRVRRIRREQDLTQASLAAAAGMAKNSINKVERGHMNPSAESVVRIADALGVPVGALYEEREPALLGEGLPGWATTSNVADFSERVSKLSAEELGRLAEALALSAPPVITREDLSPASQEDTERVISHARMLVVHNKFIAEGIQPPRRFTIAHRRHLEALADSAEGEVEADHGATEVE
jgi:transcriptional regulator with XRE-family HTH domain